MPKVIDFQPLQDQLKKPELLISDFAKFDRPAQLHVGVQSLHEFTHCHNGQLPRAHNEEDAAEVFKYAQSIAKQGKSTPGHFSHLSERLTRLETRLRSSRCERRFLQINALTAWSIADCAKLPRC